MKYGTTFLLLISSVTGIYAQTDFESVEKQRAQTMLSQTTKTMVVNTNGVNENVAESFKNELSNWKDKILSVHRDKSSHNVTLVYNGLLTPRDLEDVLNKYNFNRDQIISHK